MTRISCQNYFLPIYNSVKNFILWSVRPQPYLSAITGMFLWVGPHKFIYIYFKMFWWKGLHFFLCYIFCRNNIIITCILPFVYKTKRGVVASWPWSYGSWIYNYLCNQCLSPLMLWVRISIRARCTTLCEKVCQWLATGRWFSPRCSLVLVLISDCICTVFVQSSFLGSSWSCSCSYDSYIYKYLCNQCLSTQTL
jgi:hypothetical protein